MSAHRRRATASSSEFRRISISPSRSEARLMSPERYWSNIFKMSERETMTTPPKKKQRISQQELNQLFDDQEWETRLQGCARKEIYNRAAPIQAGFPSGTLSVGFEYYENND